MAHGTSDGHYILFIHVSSSKVQLDLKADGVSMIAVIIPLQNNFTENCSCLCIVIYRPGNLLTWQCIMLVNCSCLCIVIYRAPTHSLSLLLKLKVIQTISNW